MTSDCYVRVGGLAELEAVLGIQRESAAAPQWSLAVWRGLLQAPANDDPLRRLFVAVDGDGIAGFLVMMLAGSLAEIESLAVAAAQRRNGLGAMLCRHVMLWCAERGASQIELEVRAQNAAARALYAGLGFAEQGVRKGYYRHPDDDAVLLSAAL